MSKAIVDIARLPEAEQARFKQLTSAPRLAIPTAILLATVVITCLVTYTLCVMGRWPLWLGTTIITIVGYLAFSVGHDGAHRTISSNTRLNDRLGQLGMMPIMPYIDLRMFRWGHILHHRFASGDRDPDKALNGPWWSLPLRWAFIDVVYFVYALRHGDKVSKPYLRQGLVNFAIFAVLAGAAIYAGYGKEIVMLWLIPSRLIFVSLGFSFFWLPHVPHDVTQEENFTRATTIRQGFEWLLGPVLQYQNYHLIHHLYPMTPFYNNYKVWLLLEPELRKKDLAIQHNFDIHPEIRFAPSAQS